MATAFAEVRLLVADRQGIRRHGLDLPVDLRFEMLASEWNDLHTSTLRFSRKG